MKIQEIDSKKQKIKEKGLLKERFNFTINI